MTGRLARLRDERGSMPMLLLVMLVGLTFGALLIPMIITQDQTTRFDISRTRSLQAAQAGVEVGLGLIGSAVTNPDDRVGDPTKLPCGPLAGRVGGGVSTYSVTVDYYLADPAAKLDDPRWLADNRMTCSPGLGTYRKDPRTGAEAYVPKYALLTSKGADGPGVNGASPGRTLQSTYVLRTTNSIASGGTIQIYPDASGDYCMDAGASPQPGSSVTVRQCDAAGRPKQQLWTYNDDNSIRLASSLTTLATVEQAGGNGLCLDSVGAHAVGDTMTLRSCAPQRKQGGALLDRDAPWNQRWDSDVFSHLRAYTPSGDSGELCVAALTPRNPAAPLDLRNCTGRETNPRQAWLVNRDVGPGDAGTVDPPTATDLATPRQLVNAGQAGRCLDIPGAKVNATYLTAFPCKDASDPAVTIWNQLWAFRSGGRATGPGRPDKGQWVVQNQGKTDKDNTYCLSSTRKPGEYIKVIQCPQFDPPSALRADSTFEVFRTTGSDGNELPYAKKYTIVDPAGLCMGLAGENDLHSGEFSKVIATECDGSESQKWNASSDEREPTLATKSGLQNTREIPFAP